MSSRRRPDNIRDGAFYAALIFATLVAYMIVAGVQTAH